jgi:hypothetical protein
MAKNDRPHVLKKGDEVATKGRKVLLDNHRHWKHLQMGSWGAAPEGPWYMEQGQVQGCVQVALSGDVEVVDFV